MSRIATSDGGYTLQLHFQELALLIQFVGVLEFWVKFDMYLCFVELSLVLHVKFDGVLEFLEDLVAGLTPDGFRTVICDVRLTRRDHLVGNLE